MRGDYSLGTLLYHIPRLHNRCNILYSTPSCKRTFVLPKDEVAIGNMGACINVLVEYDGTDQLVG